MVIASNGTTLFNGKPSGVSLDLMCIVTTLNEMKKEDPVKYNSIRYEFMLMAKEEEDNYLYSELKEFVENLKDFFE